MTQENKQLLLKDLCARLPYGVKITDGSNIIKASPLINIGVFVCDGTWKPYLRPMSSMTEEEKEEYHNLSYEEEREEYEFGEWVTRVYYHDTIESIDWLLENHFDYRGLIEKGLAIEVTDKDNPYKI